MKPCWSAILKSYVTASNRTKPKGSEMPIHYEKVSSVICGQRRPRSACASAQSDQDLRCPLTESLDTIECINGKLCACAVWICTFCACSKIHISLDAAHFKYRIYPSYLNTLRVKRKKKIDDIHKMTQSQNIDCQWHQEEEQNKSLNSRTSVARTSLGPWQFVRGMGS